jgi:hypothetical protein
MLTFLIHNWKAYKMQYLLQLGLALKHATLDEFSIWPQNKLFK